MCKRQVEKERVRREKVRSLAAQCVLHYTYPRCVLVCVCARVRGVLRVYVHVSLCHAHSDATIPSRPRRMFRSGYSAAPLDANFGRNMDRMTSLMS